MYEELRKKLAEWAGFKHGWFDWRYPDGEYWRELPNFTESLDPCFKWFGPKLEYFFEFRFNETLWKDEDKRWRCRLFNKGFKDRFESYGNTPALALCRAIEKLIDALMEVPNAI